MASSASSESPLPSGGKQDLDYEACISLVHLRIHFIFAAAFCTAFTSRHDFKDLPAITRQISFEEYLYFHQNADSAQNRFFGPFLVRITAVLLLTPGKTASVRQLLMIILLLRGDALH